MRGNRLDAGVGRWVMGEASGGHGVVWGVGRWGEGRKEQWDGLDEGII